MRVPQPREATDGRAVEVDRTGTTPDVPNSVTRRTVAEPELLRTGAEAVLGMVLMAVVLGAVGAVALFWLVTSLLAYVR